MAKILVVDDVEDTREGIQDILKHLGHHADGANDGEDAENFIENFDYDLIVTDIMMPNKNGFDLIKSIKKQKPNSKILAISGGGKLMNADFATALASMSCQKTLKKPFTKQEFVDSVNQVLTDNAAAA